MKTVAPKIPICPVGNVSESYVQRMKTGFNKMGYSLPADAKASVVLGRASSFEPDVSKAFSKDAEVAQLTLQRGGLSKDTAVVTYFRESREFFAAVNEAAGKIWENARKAGK